MGSILVLCVKDIQADSNITSKLYREPAGSVTSGNFMRTKIIIILLLYPPFVVVDILVQALCQVVKIGG